MGKGARSRALNAGKKTEEKERVKIETQKKAKNKLFATVASIVLVVVVAGAWLFNMFYYANGAYLRNSVVASTINYEVDNAMMTYVFESSYMNTMNSYGAYLGIDETKSLKKQYIDEESGATMFDTFLDQAKSSIESSLVLAEAAKEEGLTLSESENAYVEKVAKDTAPYFADLGVNEEDIAKTMEITMLSQKYTSLFNIDKEYSEDEVDTYFSENMNDYRTVDYRVYTINYLTEESEESNNYLKEVAQEKLAELEKITSEDEFVTLVTEMIKETNPEATEEELETFLTNTDMQNMTYLDEDQGSTWAFDDSREVGDVFSYDDEESQFIKFYFLKSTAQRDESSTVDLRTIALATESYDSVEARDEAAQKIYDEFLADPTQENFSNLAMINTEDVYAMSTGGLYKAISEEEAQNISDEMYNWLFDSERVAGDSIILPNENATNIIYFVDNADQAWAEAIKKDLNSAEYNTKYEELKAKYLVTFDTEKMNDIPA